MCDHRADAAAAQDVAFGARNGERGWLDALRLTFERREIASPDAEQAHGETPHFAAQSSAGTERRNASAVETDPPAEKEIGRHAAAGAEAGARASGKRERAEVLQEEIPLLGKEQVEPREVHLLLVDLDLREVGVGRDVDGQVLCHAVLEIAPDPVRRVVREAGRHRRVGRHDPTARMASARSFACRTAPAGRQASPPMTPSECRETSSVRAAPARGTTTRSSSERRGAG